MKKLWCRLTSGNGFGQQVTKGDREGEPYGAEAGGRKVRMASFSLGWVCRDLRGRKVMADRKSEGENVGRVHCTLSALQRDVKTGPWG